MGKESKRSWAKKMVSDHKISFLCLQETKVVIEHEWQVKSVWGGNNLGFAALDSSGNSAGILTVWNDNLFKLQSSFKQEGFVAVLGLWQGNNAKLGVINVYAPQNARRKKELWENISRVMRLDTEAAWIVCGDFNEVRSADERKGSTFDPLGARCFNSFISSAGLSEFSLGGRKFTWMNADCSKLSKLDRFLASVDFVALWPSAHSLALPRIYSDHCPILLDCGRVDFGPTPFKLFNSWLAKPGFEDLVRGRWNDPLPEFEVFSKVERLSRKLRHLKALIKSWNVDSKKNSDQEIASLKQKIAAIDVLAEASTLDNNTVKERGELLLKLGDLVSAKTSDLKQKAKARWLLDGDENTRFFHGLVNHKMKKSRIHGLNVNGSWVTDADRIKEAARSFFENKFAESHPFRPTISSSLFKKITDSQRASLEAPFTEKEVKDAVWSCGNNKAPGPDGFTFEFVRKYWDIVGKDFVEVIKFFESNHRLNPGSNSSFITLVPKVSDPLSLADYRPINLIGCITKLISKILAERLKGVLNSIISHSQTAFIKGRNGIWREKWRDWVMGCICTAKASILINGSPSKEFHLGKGARQGDPLAPFLFILAAEGLSVVMREAHRANLFNGVKLDNLDEELSVFQFADDAIFIGDWSLINAKNLIRILKCFEAASGLKINMEKSRLSGVSVTSNDVSRMARWLGCKEESVPFRYLGLPVGGNMKLVANWQSLIDKFRMKLSSEQSLTAGSNRGERGIWNSICGIEKDLRELGINLNSLMQRNEAANRWEWVLESNKLFSVRSLRQLIDAIHLPTADEETDWTGWIPSKANILLWRVLLNRLATKDNLLARGVSLSTTDCPMCLTNMENLDHLMALCSTTKVVNAYLRAWVDWWPTGTSSTQDFWMQICSSRGNPVHTKVRKVIGAAFFWTIWTKRNITVFKGKTISEKEIFSDIQFLAFNWVKCRSKGGNSLRWESWTCNPVDAVLSCNPLAPR
ncbi:hypothetical protein OSB04_024932 [Centaurea solstitialis]|uniref:Reverse transcriptase domain-containing protein n=1 Tax=Centaurea solstitialis TaxID=347529 RepID=A0AA38WAV3_9ASTR|nr:hypothetical protein OSB04_024932 [Centaurea solstitialis]